MAAPLSPEKRLQEIVRQLPQEQAKVLLEFAEFLRQRYGERKEIAEPVALPRPDKETVVRAIQRLRASYPMLDSTKLLTETSTLMSQHVMQGRDVVEVIDELEVLFRQHYKRSTEQKGD